MISAPLRFWVWLLALSLASCVSTPKVALDPQDPPDALQQQLAIDAALHVRRARPGNRVTLLQDGTETFPAMFEALRNAHDHINLEYYTFENVHVAGESLGDILERKLRAGVAVNVIMDAYGSARTDPAFLARLREAGARILVFHPLTPAAILELKNPNDRDHRKIMVIDGRVAFVGGVNLDRVYENPPDPNAIKRGDADHAFWSDIDARIEGPAVEDLQHVFFDTWARQNGPAMQPRNYFPTPRVAGDQVVRIIDSAPRETAPREGGPLYYASFLAAVHAAQHSIDLSTGFFVPTHQEREELRRAAQRGVAVRLVLPAISSVPETVAAGRAAYGDLLEVGVRIWERQDAVLHSKFVTIDGVWTAVGSSNLDRRSVVYNNEVDAIILGRETAKAARAMISRDIAHAKEITLSEWRNRSFDERLHEFYGRLWQFLM